GRAEAAAKAGAGIGGGAPAADEASGGTSAGAGIAPKAPGPPAGRLMRRSSRPPPKGSPTGRDGGADSNAAPGRGASESPWPEAPLASSAKTKSSSPLADTAEGGEAVEPSWN